MLAIVRDMTAAGLGLNRFCYAGLIAAQKNKTPITDDLASKIIELVEQSKGWSSVDRSNNVADSIMLGITEEELYNIPTAEYVRRRGFVTRQFTVYHAALHAFADLKDVDAMETLLDMLQKDGKVTDVYMVMQSMRCYLRSGDIDRGLQTFEEYMNAAKPPFVELYVTLIEGAMLGHTPRGMQLAQDTLVCIFNSRILKTNLLYQYIGLALLVHTLPLVIQVNMNSRKFFLTGKMGSDLLLAAAGEKTGGYTTANMIWDMMQACKITPSLPAVDAYYNGLKGREIPKDDPRLMLVSRTLDGMRFRSGPGPARP